MTVTLLRLEQIRKTDNPDDTLSASAIANIEATAVDGIDFLTGELSQTKRIIHGDDAGNWFDDIMTVHGGNASLKALYNRATLEGKYAISYRLNLIDLTLPASAYATGTITCVSKAELVDGEKVVINDGTQTVNFWIDQTGTYTPPGGYDATNVRVNVNGCTDADSVKAVFITEINNATINITASSGGTGVVDLTHDTYGYFNYDITETVSDTDFVVTGMTGGAVGNVALLTGTYKPDKVIAYGGTAIGAVCAKLATLIGVHSLDESGGSDALHPKSLAQCFNGDDGEALLSDDRRIFALLQVGSGATDGAAFGNTGSANQGQLSFVRANATFDDLEACPVVDITGKKVIYCFSERNNLKDIPEVSFRGDLEAVDPSGVTVSLDTAYDGGNFMTVDGDSVDIRLSDTKEWVFRKGSGGAVLLKLTRTDAGTADELLVDSAVDKFTVKATTNDFYEGIVVDSAGTDINLGNTPGQIDATALTVAATSTDLLLQAADDVQFKTVRETSALPLDDATAGKISTLFSQTFASVAAAIKYAGEHGGTDMSLKLFTSGLNYNQGDNIPAAIQNITSYPIDMNTIGAVTQLVFLNGRLLIGGNGTTKNDVYAGTTPASGDIKVDFAKGIKTGDVILSVVLAQ